MFIQNTNTHFIEITITHLHVLHLIYFFRLINEKTKKLFLYEKYEVTQMKF